MYSKCAWEKYQKVDIEKVMTFCEGYKKFISECKTERECVKYAEKLAKEYGYKNLDDCKSLKTGDKVYAINKGKNIVTFIIVKRILKRVLIF